jgi:hypothetical protein
LKHVGGDPAGRVARFAEGQGFTGTITDSRGRKRHYRDGKQVRGEEDGSGQASTPATRQQAAQERQKAVQGAHDGIKAVLGGDNHPETAQKLIGHLSTLTTRQLHDLKKQYQLSASGPLKAKLVAKLADRLSRGRIEAQPAESAPAIADASGRTPRSEPLNISGPIIGPSKPAAQPAESKPKPAELPAKPAEPAVKKPLHEVPYAEWLSRTKSNDNPTSRGLYELNLRDAKAAGKEIPASVAADYPGLADVKVHGTTSPKPPEEPAAPPVAAPSVAHETKPTNPFRDEAAKLRAKADRLSGGTAHDQAMARAFPFGTGRPGNASSRRTSQQAARRIDSSIDRAKEAVELYKKANALDAQAGKFDAGDIDAGGRPTEKVRQAEAEKTQKLASLNESIAGYMRSTLKPGDTVYVNGNPVSVKRVNPTGVTTEGGSRWSYDELLPHGENGPMSMKDVIGAAKEWAAKQPEPNAAEPTKPASPVVPARGTVTPTDTLRTIYSTALDHDFSHANLDKTIAELAKFSRGNLLEAARKAWGVDLHGSKEGMLEQIKRKITERRSFHSRVALAQGKEPFKPDQAEPAKLPQGDQATKEFFTHPPEQGGLFTPGRTGAIPGHMPEAPTVLPDAKLPTGEERRKQAGITLPEPKAEEPSGIYDRDAKPIEHAKEAQSAVPLHFRSDKPPAELAKRPTREYRDNALAAVDAAYQKVRTLYDRLADSNVTFKVKALGRQPGDIGTHYRGRIEGLRSGGAPHPTPTVGDIDKSVRDAIRDLNARASRLVEEATNGSKATTFAEGCWITIGGKSGEDGTRHGGAPVYVEGGRITKGHPNLTGKKLGALDQKAEGVGVRKANTMERDYSRAAWGKKAKAEGVEPSHLHSLANDIVDQDREYAGDYKRLVDEAHDALAEFGGTSRTLTMNAGRRGPEEGAGVRGMDEVSQHLAKKYPHLFKEENGENGLHQDQLFNLLRDGAPEPISEEDAYEQALSHLVEQKRREPKHDDNDAVPFSEGDHAAEIDAAAADAHPSPTEGQREAGNYRKGHVTLHGLPITIENAAGSTRSGTDAAGNAWSQEMAHHYGYIKRTESEADGDHVDVFLGPLPQIKTVFVVDQLKPDGSFDEHKTMMGFPSAEAAKAAYHANYSPDWKGFGGITRMPLQAFKEWLQGGATDKPLSRRPHKVAKFHDVSGEARDNGGKWTAGGSGGASGSRDNGGMKKITLWRAANDDIVNGTASFATDRESAEKYLDNPGFGGTNLYRSKVEIDPEKFLDLHDLDKDDAVAKIRELTGLNDPGAIGVDEWVPRIADKLADSGIEWVRVKESYPSDSETYIFVGGDDPEMEEVDR